jgi:hypothetical protein
MSTATTHTGTNIAFIMFSAAVVFPEKVGTFCHDNWFSTQNQKAHRSSKQQMFSWDDAGKKPGICAIIVLDKDPSLSTLLMTLEKPF